MTTSLKVLVIEDEPALRERIVQMLCFEGYDAQGVADGRNGIERARAFEPDLIVCDLLMPGINGFGACRVLRDEPVTRETPIVVISALSTPSDRERAAGLGVRDYLTKPFRNEELIETVARCLNGRDAPA